MRCIQDYSRLKIISCAGDRMTAGSDQTPFLDRIIHLSLKKFHLSFSTQWSNVNTFFSRLTHVVGFYFLDKFIDIFLIYFFMYINAFNSAATLSVVVKCSVCRGSSYRFNVSIVVADIQWIFTTQLKLARYHLRRN